MKVLVKQYDLKRGLSVVAHAVAAKATLPILNNVLLEASGTSLKISATNLEIGITVLVDAEVDEEGSTTTPAKRFIEVIASQPPGEVELMVAEDHTLHIQTLRSQTDIRGMEPSEYPQIPTAEDGEPPITLEASLLKQMITQTAFTAAEDESRPIFTGVLLQVADENITLVAADSFRLAVRTASLPGCEQTCEPLLVPAKTLTELSRILPAEGQVHIIATPSRHQVVFHTETVDLVSRLIEGTFPNFFGAIPKEHTTRAEVSTREFAAATKSVMPFARESSNIARIQMSRGSSDGLMPGSLTLEATAEDIGGTVNTIHSAVDGPEQRVILNAKYLSDVLGVLDTPQVALEITSPARPLVLKPIGDGIDATYIIMPLTTNR